ncbi:hypothetical protein [Actinomadura sp. B10D3]|uniref:hypothetical protein n=1 Tax=Actinomadura sp. B10D3 TaxID=3153557 RepID=UPI00325C6979
MRLTGVVSTACLASRVRISTSQNSDLRHSAKPVTSSQGRRRRRKAPTMSMPPSLITTRLRRDAAETTARKRTSAVIATMPATRPTE